MFIKHIVLSNFKGFIGDNHKIDLNTPTGELGSGLNIFIGENNAGKSSVFEAVDFLRNGCKEDSINLLKSKLNDDDQSEDAVVEIIFSGELNDTIKSFVPTNKQNSFIELVNESGELISRRCTSELKKIYLHNGNEYTNPSGIDAPFKALFDTNFIWADTNPNSEAAFGASTLCGLLLKEIAKTHTDTEEYREFQKSFNRLFNSDGSELRKKLSDVEEDLQDVFKEQFGEAKINFKFDELKIDSFFKNASIFINDGIDIPMSEKGSGMQRTMALALLQVYANRLANSNELSKTKPFYLFIDEPELCLHPKGQSKLFKALLEISKTQQIFLTTHSPYFLVTPYLKNIGLFLFTKDGVKNKIEDVKLNPIFPWSPTWGEINFKAYKLPTVEFHNELYGELQLKSEKGRERAFEQWLIENGLSTSKNWMRDDREGASYSVTLQTFIRNHIHHPENERMRENPYTIEELEKSIEEMISLLSRL